jgi:DNA replication and repair protein RecF
LGRLCLTRLTLSHFRSYRHAVVEADGRPVAIHGPNGAGKTSLLEAVSMFSPGRGMRRAGAEDLIRRPETLGWKLTAIIQSLHQVHELETTAEPGAARSVRIDGKATAQAALGRVARVLWLVPSMDRLWIEGAEGRRRFLDRMTLSFNPAHAEASLAYEKAMRERNRLLKDMVRDDHWYVALEGQMAEAGAQITANRQAALDLLKAATGGAATAFPAPDLALRHAEGDLPGEAEALRAALADGRRRDLHAGRTLIGPHRIDLEAHWAEKGIAAKDASTGEQKALLISLILANARALADDFGAPPILLLDEVAAHLDADRRAALYDEVCALGAQAWMTGTGAELFAELDNRAQHLRVTEDSGESQIEKIS